MEPRTDQQPKPGARPAPHSPAEPALPAGPPEPGDADFNRSTRGPGFKGVPGEGPSPTPPEIKDE